MLKNNKHIHTYIFIIVTLIICFLYVLNIFEPLEVKTQDYRFPGALDQSISKNIVLITIDDEDLNKYGKWPLNRSIHGKVIDALKKAGAAVIGLDIMLSIPSANATEDEFLARSIKEAGNVILPYRCDMVSTMVSNQNFKNQLAEEKIYPAFSNVCRDRGFVNIDLDYLNPDGVLRNVELFNEFDNSKRFSFPLIIAKEFLKFKNSGKEFTVETGKDAIKIGENTVPLFRFYSYSRSGLTAHQCYLIKYNGTFQSGIFPAFSYSEVLEGGIPPDVFKGKAVLIGAQSAALIDVKLSPLGMTPGMFMTAQVIDNIIKGDYIIRPGIFTGVIMIIILGTLVYCFLVVTQPSYFDLLYLPGFVSAIAMIECVLFSSQKLLLEMVAPLSQIILLYAFIRFYQLFFTLSEKEKLAAVFSRYVSSQVIKELTRNPDSVKLGGKKQNTTILFSDIRGFTPMSEKMEPEALVELLNEYFSEMSAIVFNNNGTLDKYIGDAMMVLFGAPITGNDDEFRAVKTAIEMRSQLKKLNEKFEKKGLKALEIGIGINTGSVIAGNIGNEHRLEYTVVGDAVNIASRLCSAAKAGQIIISESTYDRVKDLVIANDLETISVKGKTEKISIFEVSGIKFTV